jgi:hypothetical protein
MMRRGAGLDPDDAGCKKRKEGQHFAAAYLAAQNGRAFGVDSMNLEHILCDI